MHPFRSRMLTLAALLAIAGCARAPAHKMVYSEAELAQLLRDRLGPDASSIPIPYQADAEMIAFARAAVAGEGTTRGKVDALMRAITAKAQLNVRYDLGSSITAREVFDSGRANCIAYTNLFVALARSVGLEALYADVTERTHYVRRASMVIHIGHICAAVRDGPSVLLVDFADASRLRYLGYRLIDDVEAVANFVINQGFDFGGLMAAGDTRDARLVFSDQDMEKFRLALRIKPGFAKGLLNFGTAYLLRGQPQVAERCFRDAIRSDPDYGPAYTALGGLLAGQQRVDDAISLYEQAASRQKHNPYLYYNLALVDFRLRRYKDAAKAARQATRVASRYGEPFADPYHLLGIIAQIRGRLTEARERFLQALKLDPSLEDARTRLAHVNEMLGLDGRGSEPLALGVETVAGAQ
jgi:tetratricopeptide (TPR) repeat protein